MNRFNDLKETYTIAWDLIEKASQSSADPMRTPVMATAEAGLAHQRTIVLRDVQVASNLLFFFSDSRAPKIRHLKNNPKVNLLFYDPKKGVQIEASGEGLVFSHNEAAKNYWNRLNWYGRSNYAAEAASGQPISQGKGYLPDFWSPDMELKDTEYAYDHFAVIQIQVQHLDVLHLHEEGHQRAQFSRNSPDWNATWVVP